MTKIHDTAKSVFVSLNVLSGKWQMVEDVGSVNKLSNLICDTGLLHSNDFLNNVTLQRKSPCGFPQAALIMPCLGAMHSVGWDL